MCLLSPVPRRPMLVSDVGSPPAGCSPQQGKRSTPELILQEVVSSMTALPPIDWSHNATINTAMHDEKNVLPLPCSVEVGIRHIHSSASAAYLLARERFGHQI